jgi:N-acetylmuramoyl-L-alanine amidase
MARKSRYLMLILILLSGLYAFGTEIELPSGKGTIKTTIEKGQEVVALSDLVRAMGGKSGRDEVSLYPVWEVNSHRIVFSTNTSMLSVDGKIVSLKVTPTEKNGDLLLGTEFIAAVFPKLGFPVDVRVQPEPAAKTPPQQEAAADGKISIEKTVAYDLVRVTFKGPMVSLSETKKDDARITVRLAKGKADAVKEKLGEGIVTDMVSQADGREIVFTLDNGFKSFETVNLKNPERLVLIIKGEGQKTPAPETRAEAAAAVPAPVPSTPAKRSGRVLVVLDPGHGGQDTGALGKEGAVEKALTLDLATKLKEALEKEGIDVLMTRSSDVLVPLRERTAIANFNKADFFLSIHFNSSPLKSVKGSESYIMSREATDLWSKELAEKENVSSQGEVKGNGLSLILWSLAQNQYLVESTSIAGELQQSLNVLFGTNDRGVRQAPFAVLEGAEMPAVLLEVAFLSNPSEAKDIQNPEFAGGIIKAIVSPLIRFKERNVPPPNN